MSFQQDIDYGGRSLNTDFAAGTTLKMIPTWTSTYPQNDSHDELNKLSPVDNLFPALVECFGIILLGYIAGR